MPNKPKSPRRPADASPTDAPAVEAGRLKPAKDKPSPAERIRALEAEITRIRQEEHDSRHSLVVTALAELNAMGYRYRLVDEGKAKPGRGGAPAEAPAKDEKPALSPAASAQAHYNEAKYCKLCKEHGHDTRAHTRAGEWKDKAFNNEERARRGLLPPELAESFVREQR